MINRIMIKQEYIYNANVVDVYDGDTITVDIDLGFGVWLKGQKLRLYGINAPELRGDAKEAGQLSKKWLESKISGKTIVIQTLKDRKEKYGRWLANIYLDNILINELMVTEGLSIKYME